MLQFCHGETSFSTLLDIHLLLIDFYVTLLAEATSIRNSGWVLGWMVESRFLFKSFLFVILY